MASSFGQYTGGIQGVQGISEAGANIAKITQAGYADFGKSLSDGIKAYNENDQKNQVLTQQLQGLAAQYKEVYDMYEKNPEMKPFADSLMPTMEQLNKFGSMSLSQKAGALLSGQAAYNQIAPKLQMFKDNQTSMTRQGVQDALSKEVKISDNQGGVVTATPYNTAKTIGENLALNRKTFEVQAEVGKLTKFDINSALEKLTAQWENGFANDPNMAKNDPALRDAILKNISDYRNQGKIAGEIAGQTSEEYGTGENIISQVMALGEAQQGASTSAAKALENKDMAEMLAAQKKAGITSATGTAPAGVTENKPVLTAVQKAVNAGKPIWAELNKAKADLEKADDRITRDFTYTNGEYVDKTGKAGGYVEAKEKRDALREKVGTLTNKYNAVSISDFKDDVAPPAPVRTISNIQRLAERKVGEIKPKVEEEAKLAALGKTLVEETQAKLNSIIEADGDTTITELLQNIYWEESKRNPTLKDIPMMAGDDFGFGGKGVETYTDASANLKKAASALGIPLKEKLTADQMFKVLQELEKQKVVAGTKATATAKTLEELAPETVGLGVDATTAPAVNKYARVFDFGVKIQEGVKEGFRQETFAEEKERVRQWFVTNNKGIIPSALEEVYASIRPETSVRFMPAPDGLGGQVMITPKGAQYIPPVKTTAMSDKEKSEVTLYNWGTKTASGEYILTERTPNSGIKLGGFALGGEKNAEAFQQLHADTVKIRTIVPQLLAMYKTDKLGRTLIPNENWGLAKSLLAQLKAAIRVETVGTGPVAIAEHKSILDRVSDPTAFLSLDIVGKGTLEGLLKSNEMALINNNAGIQVEFTVPKEARAKSTQQVKLTEKTRVK